jgi:hypothetical protein
VLKTTMENPMAMTCCVVVEDLDEVATGIELGTMSHKEVT